jgi:hypothetical protein
MGTACRVPTGLDCQGPCDHIDPEWEQACYVVARRDRSERDRFWKSYYAAHPDEKKEADREMKQWIKSGRKEARLPSGTRVRLNGASIDGLILYNELPDELWPIAQRLRSGFKFNDLKPEEVVAFFKLGALLAARTVREVADGDAWEDVKLSDKQFVALPDEDRSFLIRWAIGQVSEDDLKATLEADNA